MRTPALSREGERWIRPTTLWACRRAQAMEQEVQRQNPQVEGTTAKMGDMRQKVRDVARQNYDYNAGR